MKKADLTSLRTKTQKELAKVLADKVKELRKTSVAILGGTEKNLKKGRNLRVDIAKIATIIREKEILESLEKGKGDKKE